MVPDVSLVIKDAFYPLMLDFGGIVAFLMLFPLTGDVNKIKKPLYTSVGIVTLILTYRNLRALLVLGGSMINRYIYPMHSSFFIGYPVKLEIIPDTNMSLSVLIKVIILLYASATTMGNVFHAKKISPFIIAVTLTAFFICHFSMPNGLTLNEFFKGIWVYIIAIFAVFIPAILLVISLIRNGLKRRKPMLKRE
jgi:spore germination protein KB